MRVHRTQIHTCAAYMQGSLALSQAGNVVSLGVLLAEFINELTGVCPLPFIDFWAPATYAAVNACKPDAWHLDRGPSDVKSALLCLLHEHPIGLLGCLHCRQVSQF